MIVTDDISVLQFWGVPPEFQYLINDDYMTVGTDLHIFPNSENSRGKVYRPGGTNRNVHGRRKLSRRVKVRI